MSSAESSDNEAPLEMTFNEAKQAEESWKKSGVASRGRKPQKKTKKAKENKNEIDPRVKAMLESGLGEKADVQLESRRAKLERTERPSQIISINPTGHQVEQKISKNLKVICLKKIPVIAKNEKYREAKDSILHRSTLNRRPLKLNK